MIILVLDSPSHPPVGTRWKVLEKTRTSNEMVTYEGVEMPMIVAKPVK